jgi:hypothetical protein
MGIVKKIQHYHNQIITSGLPAQKRGSNFATMSRYSDVSKCDWPWAYWSSGKSGLMVMKSWRAPSLSMNALHSITSDMQVPNPFGMGYGIEPFPLPTQVELEATRRPSEARPENR